MIMRTALLVLVLLLQFGCTYTFEEIKDKDLAYLGDAYTVTVKDLEDHFKGSHQGHETLLAGEGALVEFLDGVIEKKLLLLEARRVGYDEDPEIQEYLDEYAVKKAVDSLYKQEIVDKVDITEEDLQEAYEKEGYLYLVGKIATFTREDMDKAYARITEGEDFRKVASEVSVDEDSAKRGGRLSEINWSSFKPEVAKAVESMEVGEITVPRTIDGKWVILKLMEKVEIEKKTPFDKAKSRLGYILAKWSKERRKDEYFKELSQKWGATIKDEVITAENFLEDSGDQDEEQAQKDEGTEEQEKEKVVVASFRGGDIGLDEFRKSLNKEALQEGPETYTLRLIRNVLEDRLFTELLEKEVKAEKYTETPQIQAQVQGLKKQLVYNKFANEMVLGDVKVTDDEAREYYEENKDEYVEPEAVFISNIVVSTEEKAKEIVERVNSGEDYALIAREESEDKMSAQYGGEYGWLSKGSVSEVIIEKIFALEPGELNYFEYSGKFHVVRVEKKAPERQLAFSEVKDKVKEKLLKKKTEAEVARWIERLKEVYPVVYNKRNIKIAEKYYQNVVLEKSKTTEEKNKHAF